MEDYQLPLVIFTSLSQTAAGMAIFVAWRRLRGIYVDQRKAWLTIGILLLLSLFGATFHLSYPLQGYNALINLQHAWLSREIVAAGAFAVAIAAAFLTRGNKTAVLAAALFGVVLLIVQGMTYAAPAMVAIANGLPMVFYFLTAWVMGAACLPLLDKTSCAPIMRQGILLFLLAMIVAPLVWRSGGVIMQMTALSWGTSLFFWGSLLCFIAAYLVSFRRDKATAVTALIALAAVVLSRLTFFGDTVSTVVNIGHPY
ncbi:DmsC/YnfH family molybdoenzyme membrane anchor subunit [Martelella alba]|uniref:Hydrogenase n=1 Tax=Martelella alba TaxID=2590451 RepID=A0ABY2SVE9_9HYPH|nr:DmsC/YnfH family molybdoenzyme membrane anchor subunit [Martelella alba]TKI08527.1 hydrogenase [Martelella alba]